MHRSTAAFFALAVLLVSGCANAPHPAEGLRPLPLLGTKDPLVARQVPNVQPVLQWESFPRPSDLKSDARLTRADMVTYEVRIWRAETLTAAPSTANADRSPQRASPDWLWVYPAELVYTRSGLPSSGHTIESPLSPGTLYLWAVRARFQLDGQPRVTPWSVLTATDQHQALPRPGDAALPSRGYYLIRIPSS